ncbi:MAG TPA: transposase [Terriglobales bacterium]|nr:transposase [Terriglobales bacterium]
MAIPFRGVTHIGETYFITANCIDKKNILQSDRMAGLLMAVIFHYRDEQNYLLHEFVIMPNHIHLLVTPVGARLEKCLQLIKGNFSYRAKKELLFMWGIWQGSYYDRRIRDAVEYQSDRHYIRQNPVVAGRCAKAEDWLYSSAAREGSLDPVLQGLKPHSKRASRTQS